MSKSKAQCKKKNLIILDFAQLTIEIIYRLKDDGTGKVTFNDLKPFISKIFYLAKFVKSFLYIF